MSSYHTIYKALGDSNRLQMVLLLGAKDRTVEQLQTSLGISQSSTSQHLKILSTAGLVAVKKHGNFRIYSLKEQQLKKAMHFFDALWDDSLAKLKAEIESKNE